MKAFMKSGLLLAMSLSALQAKDAVVTQLPLNVGAFQEFGAVYDGLHSAGDVPGAIISMEWVDHFGAYLNKEAVINDRLHLSGGIGGVFQFRQPEIVDAGFPGSQRKAFFVGPARTEAVYYFGDTQKPWLKLGAGMFPYKYNPEAVNLGEYLFRARAYPTTMTTGGYLLANNSGATLQGFKANYQKGDLKIDALLTTETEQAPFYDFSLGLVAAYSVANGLLDLGAGVNFQHLIPVKPSRTTNPVQENSYITNPTTGRDYVGNSNYYSNAAEFYAARADLYWQKGTHADTLNAIRDSARAAQYTADGTTASSLYSLPDSTRPSIKYYTTSAVLLMARATLDPKKVLALPMMGPQDLKLYFEVDVLGLKNYPVYYEKISERMPIMMGINLPCFRILDLLAVQAEYFNSPWLNNTFSFASGNHERVNNTPYLPISNDTVLSRTNYNDMTAKDNWKWSVLAKKTIQNRLTVSFQCARDHLRLPSSKYYYGPQFEPNEVTAFKDSWYWVTQISWGI
ncbi:MAG TPA: hypothetical protein DCQ83_01315 [Fibrobacteres bacterium]|jgi:hypothetical protein|nr:hypothetical protein [Fibrobacterota bacterium]